MKQFEQRVLAACKALLAPGDRVIAAVSGGADSMALLQFLLESREELGVQVEAVHVDHRLRPESARDAAFVAAFCAEKGVTLHARAADAPVGHRSEEWSRQLRYGCFEELAGPGVKIATAHTLSDQAETLLLRLARGAGVRGAAGIPLARGCFVRPMLGVTKAQAEDFCRRRGICWVTDEDNLTDAYARNQLRHHAMPVIQAACPGAEAAFGEFCARMGELTQYLSRRGEHLLREAAAGPEKYRLDTLAAAEAVERAEAFRLLVETCRPLRKGDVARLEELVARGAGAVQLVPGAALAAGGGRLYWKRETVGPAPFAPVPAAPGSYRLPGGFGLELAVLEGPECEETIKFILAAKKPFDNYADYDKISSSLCLRTRRPGDRYRPAGRNVDKSLKKFLSEQRVPPDRRALLPLLAAGSRVVWLWGRGFAHGLRPEGATRRLLVVRCEEKMNGEELQ